MEGDSDLAFDYLGPHLASRGYIFVSVDENFLNTAWFDVLPGGPESASRGWMLLEHLRQWALWNGQAGNPLQGKVDTGNIALIGHSRGGEAVSIAGFLNRLSKLPENGNVSLDYQYDIRSVISIAQVDGLYRPTQRGTPLADVNFLSIHGAYDGDATLFWGASQYERTSLSADSNAVKSLIYVGNANHSGFTTRWIGYEKPRPNDWIITTTPIMAPKDQHKIAQGYIAAFLDLTLKQEQAYRPLFQSYLAGQDWLPDSRYISRYADSKFLPLANFEEDLDPGTGSIEGSTLTGYLLDEWSEQLASHKDEALAFNIGQLAWQVLGARLSIEFSSPGTEQYPIEAVSLSVADVRSCEPCEPLDFSVQLGDKNGQVVALPLSHIQALQPPIHAQYMKLGIFNSLPDWEPVLQTYYFPITMFTQQNPGLDAAALSEISLVFDRSPGGKVWLDDIGLHGGSKRTSN